MDFKVRLMIIHGHEVQTTPKMFQYRQLVLAA